MSGMQAVQPASKEGIEQEFELYLPVKRYLECLGFDVKGRSVAAIWSDFATTTDFNRWGSSIHNLWKMSASIQAERIS
jgi:hypothetical protein